MKKIFVAGHNGMVGSAIVRKLKGMEFPYSVVTRDRCELDLTRQQDVEEFFKNEKVDQVYVASAKVGGIYANNEYPADFIYQNLMIQANIIHSAYVSGVRQLLFLGSSCIYPKLCDQPMKEASLLTGKLEPTNEPYAIAKIAGIKLCESYNRQYGCDYRSLMPTNLYGENDNFHSENSHVIPALMRRIHEAKLAEDSSVVVWGTGTPKREFLHVDDLANAAVHIMNVDKKEYDQHVSPMSSHINVGTGIDCSISELAQSIAKVVGYHGKVIFDSTKPDGAPRKLLDISKLNALGWSPSIKLEAGLRSTYEWFLEKESQIRI
ncbi:NAD-dependent epimerase/dehydratase family protein [Hahella sp. KA22]|uniref:GDP-L-fucose synthase n=1 Tax=Hahella sp. KA22 TaxID=1628392 RepID=UPI000FDD3FEC|nr:GDP-L-fucose synthase [Hahella sp. KA22]AZZ91690.1 GDP-L-fucose synthase [Hahella sp. KA22]QAY55060.1 NAD-dependent epimerase/dehydratase family protein [Hahella sp. KA22]